MTPRELSRGKGALVCWAWTHLADTIHLRTHVSNWTVVTCSNTQRRRRVGNNPMPRLPEPECTCTLCDGRRRQACLTACPSSCVPRLVFATSDHHVFHDASNHDDAPTIVVLQLGAFGAHGVWLVPRTETRLNSSSFVSCIESKAECGGRILLPGRAASAMAGYEIIHLMILTSATRPIPV